MAIITIEKVLKKKRFQGQGENLRRLSSDDIIDDCCGSDAPVDHSVILYVTQPS